jgi:predicted nucleic acid-binding protein
MTAVFADTSFFVAFLSSTDQYHAIAHDYFAHYEGRIITTQWVLTEVANYFASSAKRATAGEFIQKLNADARFSNVPVGASDFSEGLLLYNQRLDKEWSLTDCISFLTMRWQQLAQALTADHHFEQAGFRALLNERDHPEESK